MTGTESALSRIVQTFAESLKTVDSRYPIFTNAKGRSYRPGLGPHAEPAAVELIADEMRNAFSSVTTDVPYSRSRARLDLLVVDDGETWAIEVKMARLFGDNNRKDDMAFKHLLSPYRSDRSAVTDFGKILEFEADRRAILLYGFEDQRRPLSQVITALELLGSREARFTPPLVAPFDGLVHPVFSVGVVYGWEVLSPAPAP